MEQPTSVVSGTRVARPQLFDLKKRSLGPSKNRPVLEDLSNISKHSSSLSLSNNKLLVSQQPKQYVQKSYYNKLPIPKSALTHSTSTTSNSLTTAAPPSSTTDSIPIHKNSSSTTSSLPQTNLKSISVSASTSSSPKSFTLYSAKTEQTADPSDKVSHSTFLESKSRSASSDHQNPTTKVFENSTNVEQTLDVHTNVALKRKSRFDDEEEEEEEDKDKTNEKPAKEDTKSLVKADVLVGQTEVPSRPAKRQRTQLWDDLDAEDFDDPLMVSEYAPDIFEYLYELEVKYMPSPDYMSHQTCINWSTRDILMDWVVEIHWKLRLLPETLFLAGNIIDRFMTQRVVTLDKLQLVGTSALLIAAKYEEVFPPATKYFSILTGGNYKENDILSAEKFILQILSFELSYPNPLNFLRRISKADGYDVRNRSYGKYFLEIGCFEHSLLKYRPSHLAAASMYLARLISGPAPVWNANLEHYAGDVEEETLYPILAGLIKYLAAPKVPHETLFKKYASRKFFKASLVARKWAKDNNDICSFFSG